MINFLKKYLKYYLMLYLSKQKIGLDVDFNHNTYRLIFFYDRMINATKDIDGCIVECGVGRGFSLVNFSLANSIRNINKNIYGYDSFEGFPEPSEEDISFRNTAKGEFIDRNWISRENLSDKLKKISNSEVFLIKGFFDQTLKNHKEKISLLHLDVDLYESYKHCLTVLYPYLSNGGIIIFDEYKNSIKKFPEAC